MGSNPIEGTRQMVCSARSIDNRLPQRVQWGVFKRGLAAAAMFALAVSGFHGASPAAAATASPASITVDCGLANGVTATSITGEIGDTLAIDNTAGGQACRFSSFIGVISATNLDGSNDLAAGATSTITVLAAGTFVITPQGGSGTATTMTVVIGVPYPAPEYVVTFDANGGNCSSNPLTITATSGDWYALPTDGTGSYQCHKDDYTLIGWSHGSTVQLPGEAARVPDLKLASSSSDGSGLTHAAVADHTTLFAVWAPIGVEIVYDANVAASDTCVNDAGDNVSVEQRSVTRVVYPQVEPVSFADTPPCLPVDGLGQRLTFRGWSLATDGAVGARAPGAALPWRWEKKHGRQVQLFAQFFCKIFATEDPDDMEPQANPSYWQECANYTWDKLMYSGAPFQELSKASLVSENVCTTPPTAREEELYDGQGRPCSGSWVESGGVTDADLSGVNLSNKNLIDIWITKSDLSNSDFSGADLAGAGLQNVNFQNADFSNANMTDTVLNGSDFSGAQLAGAALTGVMSGGITGAPASLPDGWALVAGYLVGPGAFLYNSQFPADSNLSGVDLAGADLYGSVMESLNLSGADLSGSNLDNVALNGANLSGANLSGVDLVNGVELRNVNLSGVQLPGHDLKSITLSGAVLTNVNFSDAQLGNANLSGADLSGADLSGADAWSLNLSGARLSNANFSGANLTGVDLSGRNLQGVNLAGATLVGANLSGANLSGLDLAGVNLANANLTNADFSGSDLTGANLIGADTNGTNFSGANLTDVQSKVPYVPPPPPFGFL